MDFKKRATTFVTFIHRNQIHFEIQPCKVAALPALATAIINTLTLVLSVCLCVCVCVMDVTSTNESRLRENMREDRDVIICVHS